MSTVEGSIGARVASVRGSPLTNPRSSGSQAGTPSRLRGLDAARALAVAGMVMVHFGPAPSDLTGPWGLVYTVPSGRSAMLFVLLAGVGLALMARPGKPLNAVRRSLAVRAVLLLVAGLALQLAGHEVNVILQYYAGLFVVGIAVLGAPRRLLLVGALGATAVGPLVYLGMHNAVPAMFGSTSPGLLDPPGTVAVGILVTGAYPLVTWVGPFLFGMWLGRTDLQSALVHRRMVVWGTVVATVGWLLSTTMVQVFGAPANEAAWTNLMVDDPHSQMPLWLIGSTAAAIAVTGLMLAFVPFVPKATRPLTVMGQMALSVYVAHLLVLAWLPQWVPAEDPVTAAGRIAVFVAIATVACLLWQLRFARGPLESALRAASSVAPRKTAPPAER